MKHDLFLIAIALSLTWLMVGCAQAPAQNPRLGLEFPAHNLTFCVEVADTPKMIERGLMFRTRMDESGGMLFEMGRTSRQPFWMYHTLIPLDAVFLDERLQVVDVAAMVPCASEDPRACARYLPKADMRYVLEVKGGLAAKFGIIPGEPVLLTNTSRC